jgi:hypothetical protein
MSRDPEELKRLFAQLSFKGPLAPFLVLADWLQSRGDPWGDLIALQCAHEVAPDPHRRAELDRLVDERAPSVFACFGKPGRMLRLERGFVREVRLEANLMFPRDLPALYVSRGCWIVDVMIAGLDDPLVDVVCQTRALAGSRLVFVDHVLSDARIAKLRLAFPRATFHARGPGTNTFAAPRSQKQWKVFGPSNSWIDDLIDD